MPRSLLDIEKDLRQLKERTEPVERQLNELMDNNDWTDGVQEKVNRLQRGLSKMYDEKEALSDEWRQSVAHGIESGGLRTVSGDASGGGSDGPNFHIRRDPYAPTDGTETAHETRSRALTAVERWNADDTLKESATRTLERLADETPDSNDVKGVSAHVLRYSNPLYVSAFRRYASDPETYVADLTPGEARVWREAREYQRAALQTSGAVLPSPLDPTIVLTNDGVDDPMRSVARVDTTVSKSKRYITSAGSTFSFDAELTEVSDDTFTESEVEITTHKGQGFIQATLETWLDQPNFSSEVAKIIADGKARLEGDKFVTGAGDGSNEPFGIETELTGGSSEVDAAGEAIVADDVYGLIEALPPRFRQSARWQLELSTRNFIHRLHNPSGTEPALIEGNQLVGNPYVLNSSIDPYSAVDATATAVHRLLVVGDWSKYVILDRVGLSVYFVPPGVLQNTTTNLPDGRVGWYAVWRTGAESIADAAFRMLKLSTTA